MTVPPTKLTEPSARPVETKPPTKPLPAKLTDPPPVEPVETQSPTELPPAKLTDPPLVELVETPSWRQHFRSRLDRHPEWLAMLLAATAWVALALALDWFEPAGALPSNDQNLWMALGGVT